MHARDVAGLEEPRILYPTFQPVLVYLIDAFVRLHEIVQDT